MKILFKNARLLPEAMPEGSRAEDTVNVVVTDESITYIGVSMPEEPFDRIVDCKETCSCPPSITPTATPP